MPSNTALPRPAPAKHPVAPARCPIGLPQNSRVYQKQPSRPSQQAPIHPRPNPPRPSQRPTAQPTGQPVGYKPVTPPKATSGPSVVKKQPLPNNGMQMPDVKRIQQAAYAQGQKAGRRVGQAQGFQDGQTQGYTAGDKHGRKIGQEEGNRQGFSQGQKQGYTEGHKSDHASGQAQGYAKGQNLGFNDGHGKGRAEGQRHGYVQGQSQGFNAEQIRGHVSGHKQGYHHGQRVGYSHGQDVGYVHGYRQGRDEEHEINKKYIAGGAAAVTVLGATAMYLTYEAQGSDGHSGVGEDTNSINTEMGISDNEFAPGEPVEDENWYERHGAEWDGDDVSDQDEEGYVRSYEGFSGYEGESFHEDGGYIGGGFGGSDGYDMNQDDSQVYLGEEHEADRGDFTGGGHAGSTDDIDEKGQGEDSDCCECNDCFLMAFGVAGATTTIRKIRVLSV